MNDRIEFKWTYCKGLEIGITEMPSHYFMLLHQIFQTISFKRISMK